MKITDKVKNVTSTIISRFWGTLEQVNFDFTFDTGKSVNLTHEVYGKSDGIAILLYNPTTKKVILTKQFRMPVYVAGINHGFSIEVVGGAMDANETPEITAIRETEEEIGYKISKPTKITTAFLSPGILKEKVHLFISEYSEENKTKNGGGVADENEEIQIIECFFDEAFQMIETQEIIDARTIILLQYLKINGFINL
ncbi:MAG: NUDIX domain-containing protein [Flavobacteriaceae bacterium CG_4_10_14_3_um_filter_31_253]|nr:NUDIX domain-containing protein [Flavobacteriia bacterium]OIP46831.1 MAG: NUDIX domain-containing protein [Flavobacteriaceae bacterium CG2_30_31_66]PIX11201.1 MAG: NUDIX domain-containing protein [Flavobacteriaceae bacterium CG_4_8_14_3_um_filter_31_8]PIY15519.1 MAG: NUDIX domain-containing protein [Flavobacteriaceae bacterium CG_4_10_14_3_um_filter_31_253]PIZ11702.1 MAG: NUDIX domain-containing protein [Flavobacteriaceae bacterium CG_4_10_14_0_8_um_filter_31_99]PJC10845.1 MAG: NUDIX domain